MEQRWGKGRCNGGARVGNSVVATVKQRWSNSGARVGSNGGALGDKWRARVRQQWSNGEARVGGAVPFSAFLREYKRAYEL